MMMPPASNQQPTGPSAANPQSTMQNNLDVSKSTLWMGELDPWMDENWLRQLWYSFGQTVTIKMIRDKFSGMPAGYCFVTFNSPAAAMKTLNTFNGSPIPNTHKFFKLNWSSGGAAAKDRPQEYSIFVGDLAAEVSDYLLLTTFQQRYPSCKAAKVVSDAQTMMSRGYGFVRFGEEADQQKALTEMQGQYIGSRPVRVSLATPKSKMGVLGQFGMSGIYGNQGHFNDPSINSTTVFVGGLNANTTDEELRTVFQPFGDIVNIKIPPNKGCGFVQYSTRQSAELAIQQMNGAQIGSSKVRLSWGRSQNDKRGMMGAPGNVPYSQ